MRGHKMQNGGDKAYIIKNCTDKGNGHLNHQNLYSIIIKEKIPLTFTKEEKKIVAISDSSGNKLLWRKVGPNFHDLNVSRITF
jgi:hypothetical protein